MSLCVTTYSLLENEVRLDRWTTVDQVTTALERLFRRADGRFAVDVSFDALPLGPIRDLLEKLDCRACVSKRAAILLNEDISCEDESLGSIGEVAFFPAFPSFRRSAAAAAPAAHRGWMAATAVVDPELARQLLAVGIQDERSYLAEEHRLPSVLRVAAARARYRQLSGRAPEPLDILDNVSCCPPWLTGMRLKDLPLTVRQANVLRAHSLTTVGELSRFGNSGLLKLPNLGLKSVRELGETVCDALLSEPAPGVRAPHVQAELLPVDVPVADGSFLDMLRDALQMHGGIGDSVLMARWGLGEVKQTLQQLAEVHGVTRERIRQIEVKATERLRGAGLWLRFADHVEGLLESRDTPLWIDRLYAEDPWFGDDSTATHGLTTCIELFLAPRLYVIVVGDRPAVSAMSPAAWMRAVEDCNLILGPDSKAGDDRLGRLTRAVLVDKGAELRSELARVLLGPVEEGREVTSERDLDPDTELSIQLERALLQRNLM